MRANPSSGSAIVRSALPTSITSVFRSVAAARTAVLAALVIGASNINLRAAAFSDANWISMGGYPGVNGDVAAVATDGLGNLYIGGTFSIAGDVFATNIAKWNGTTWSALSSGINGGVGALLVSGNDLYVGGQFTTAGGVPATNIAKWNGTNWSSVGLGVSAQPYYLGYVSSLAVSGSDLYAAGYFTNAGGSAANYVAKWNGSSWSALGSGVDYVVQALAVSGGDLYAGGHFTTASGVPANYIARWDGTNWSALASGIDNYSRALAISGSNLYVGGYFEAAGGKVSVHVAQAVLGDAPGHNQLAGTVLSEGAMQFSYIGYPSTSYALDRAFNLTAPISWVGQQTNAMTISGVLVFTNASSPGTNNFWRVRSVP